MSSIYDAHPLATKTSTNIRLIELLPADVEDNNSPISCKLGVVSLDDGPVYTALSYVWGDETDIQSILLGGRPFAVRRNLWDLLVQYRNSGCGGFIWVDAICINQSSVQERNHQVAIMGQIYSKAELVVAWLGHGFEKPLQKLENALVSDWLGFAQHLKEVNRSVYWTRLWVVQEFVLARKLEIWSGAVEIDGDVLTSSFAGLYNICLYKTWRPWGDDASWLHMDSLMNKNLHRVRPIFEARATYHSWLKLDRYSVNGPGFLSGYMLMHQFHQAKCLDPRDHVYGLLGFINPQELAAFPLEPDYTKSTSALFVEVYNRQVQICAHSPDVNWLNAKTFALPLREVLKADRRDVDVAKILAYLDKIEPEMNELYNVPHYPSRAELALRRLWRKIQRSIAAGFRSENTQTRG